MAYVLDRGDDGSYTITDTTNKNTRIFSEWDEFERASWLLIMQMHDGCCDHITRIRDSYPTYETILPPAPAEETPCRCVEPRQGWGGWAHRCEICGRPMAGEIPPPRDTTPTGCAPA
jgi:hypothetical protein